MEWLRVTRGGGGGNSIQFNEYLLTCSLNRKTANNNQNNAILVQFM